MMKYKKGDVLVDKYGGEYKVLEIVGCLYAISDAHDFETFRCWCTENDAEDYEFTLKSRPKEDWTPEAGDSYYFIGSDGDVRSSYFDNISPHITRKNFLGIFRTEAEAEARLQEIKDKLK